jgi:hypothetical protein
MTRPSALAEITVVAKIGGPLTKRISLADDEHLVSDGSACTISRGSARRWLGNVHEFAQLLERLGVLPRSAVVAFLRNRRDPLSPDEIERCADEAIERWLHSRANRYRPDS